MRYDDTKLQLPQTKVSVLYWCENVLEAIDRSEQEVTITLGCGYLHRMGKLSAVNCPGYPLVCPNVVWKAIQSSRPSFTKAWIVQHSFYPVISYMSLLPYHCPVCMGCFLYVFVHRQHRLDSTWSLPLSGLQQSDRCCPNISSEIVRVGCTCED